MTKQQRNGFVLVLLVLGLLGLFVVFSSRQAPVVAQQSLVVRYSTAEGVTREVELTKVAGDAFDGARFVLGSSAAQNTIVEFADYQCPACALFAANTERQLEREFVQSGKVRYAFRDFPLPQHQNAMMAAQAVSCAHEAAGDYRALKSALFRNQSVWSNSLESAVKKQFADLAAAAGVKQVGFERCLESGNARMSIEADFQLGRELGVTSTPSFVVNGYRFAGALPIEAFRAILAKVGK
ncbi:MAG: DsbA family protein [Deinococcales bacterium]